MLVWKGAALPGVRSVTPRSLAHPTLRRRLMPVPAPIAPGSEKRRTSLLAALTLPTRRTLAGVLAATLSLALAGACTATAAANASIASLDTPKLKSFLDNHCADCHDADSKKGGLNLENLSANLTEKHAFEIWEKIHDRVDSGEMPPKKKTAPPTADRREFLTSVNKALHATSESHQKTAGRVLFRRMNRVEYENALHDLLGIATPLRELLPEDSFSGGFDTISAALETSGVHLVRYQQAADRALRAAFDGHRPVVPATTRMSGREYLQARLPVHRKGMDPFMRLDGDSLILHARVYGDNSMQAPKPATPGRYKVRAALRPVGTDGKPMSVLIARRVDRFEAEKLLHVIDYRDLQPDVTQVVEVETELGYQKGAPFVYFEALELPSFQDFEKQHGKAPALDAGFAGPGLLIEWAELEGPLQGELGYQRLFGALPQRPRMANGKPAPENWRTWNLTEFTKNPLEPVAEDPNTATETLLRSFLPLAFRGPVSEPVLQMYNQMAASQREAGESFEEALRTTYRAILCSPFFLQDPESPGRLDAYAIAARLARMLWSSVPDSTLLQAAAAGDLDSPAGVRAQCARMLADPKARRFSEDFTGQWLELRRFLDMKPDDIYVEYDDLLKWSMPRETRRFFEEVLAKNLPAAELIDSKWSFLNQRLAQHYGIEGVTGMELRRAPLPKESHRGGILTQGSVLKLTTNSSYTSPVKRGAWLLERIIGKPPPPPPPNVKAVEPDIRGAVTIREQLDKHKEVPSCASCHAQIDPPGFALENFDVLGGWREFYRVKKPAAGGRQEALAHYPGKKVFLAKPVEAFGTTSDGVAFSGVDDFKQILLQDRRQIARNLLGKFLVYGTGAELQFADRRAIEAILDATAPEDWGVKSLLEAAVSSPIFLNK